MFGELRPEVKIQVAEVLARFSEEGKKEIWVLVLKWCPWLCTSSLTSLSTVFLSVKRHIFVGGKKIFSFIELILRKSATQQCCF